MQSLDYRLKTSNTSYVTARHDVQYFPSSLSSFSPTTSRVCRIPLTSGTSFIDPESIKIAFRVRNTDGANPLAPATPNPACFVQRVQVFANGQRCDDINYYGRTVAVRDLLKGREYNRNKAMESFDEVNDPRIARAVHHERRDWLPVNELGGATRHPAHLTEEQVAQRVRQQWRPRWTRAAPSCSSRTRPTRYRNSRTEVETLLRQRMRGLRSVSFQPPCEEDVLQSAFEDKPLCVPRQLAELLQLSVEEVCADFDAMLRHDWRRLLRVAQRDARAELAGRPGGQLRSGAEGAPHRVLLGL